jgi:hypothetical protein
MTSTLRMLKISDKVLTKIIEKVIKNIDKIEKNFKKLGGKDKVVHIDETMLNYKCKSHRERFALNKQNQFVSLSTIRK